MNKLTKGIALFILSISLGVNAQEAATGTPVSQYPVLTNKLKKSEASLENPKKTASAKYWLSRAELMMDIFEVNIQHLGVGMAQLNMQIFFGAPKEKKTETKDDKSYEIHIHEKVTITYLDGLVYKYEETNKIHPEPLPFATEALKTATEKDVEGKSTKKIKEAYTRLQALFVREGVEKYQVEDYTAAYNNFVNSVNINLMEMNSAVIDTSVIYNAGTAASKAQLNPESIKYYELARSYNYPEPNLYMYLKNKYWEEADTAKGVDILKDGFEKYPGNSEIVIQLINYYLTNNQASEALEYLKIAQEKDPINISLIFAEGTLYDKQGEVEKTIATYKRCTELDPKFYDGYFNIGVVYYNYAQKLYDEANDIKNNTEYNAHVKLGDETLAKTIEPMKKCLELNPGDKDVIDVLKSVYYRLKMTEEYEAVKEQLKE